MDNRKFITDSYKKKESEITVGFPDFIKTSIAEWIYSFLLEKSVILTVQSLDFPRYSLKESYKSHLNLYFKRSFPSDFGDFCKEIFEDYDLGIEVLNYFLTNTNIYSENKLEKILRLSGHEYKVSHIGTKKVCLTKRVPKEFDVLAEKVLSLSEKMMEAWNAFYGKDPDYEKTVCRCCDVIETFIKQNHFPKSIPKFGRLVTDLRSKVKKDDSFYLGKNIDNNSNLFEIVKEFQNYRNHHTSGTGKKPTKEDAEYILCFSIVFLKSIGK